MNEDPRLQSIPTSEPTAATLAILCGGRGQRLGTDKGLFAPLDDETMVARAVRLWGSAFAEILIVTRDTTQAQLYAKALESSPTPGIRIVCDADAPGSTEPSALNGVITALHHATHALVVTIPVDQAGVRERQLERLVATSRTSTAVAFAQPAGDLLPFPSAWHKSLAPDVRVHAAFANLSVRKVLAALHAHALDPGDSAPDLALNLNTPEDFRAYFGAPLHDPYGRRLHYLRFSLTEACNMSCTYCLPDGFPEWMKHQAKLGKDDIATLLAGFRQLGFRKVRFTGGEPTVHPACKEAIATARHLGYEQIALTTNGLRMGALESWIDAGLTSINVSLDSLDDDVFFKITKSRGGARVRELIETAALHSPLEVKINTVLMRSLNGTQAQIERLLDWALALPVSLRFIELMETKLNGRFASEERVLGHELTPWLEARGLVPAQAARPGPGARPVLDGPATLWTHPQGPGTVGLINPMSCNFCSRCNRLRVTARGALKLCLFGDKDVPLDMTTPSAVALNVRQFIDRKPERHYLEAGNVGNVATFRTIGG